MSKKHVSFLTKFTGIQTQDDDEDNNDTYFHDADSKDENKTSRSSVTNDGTLKPGPGAVSDSEEPSWLGSGYEGQLAIDVYQTDTHVVIKSAVAGVKPEDLDVAITNDMITIRGSRTQEEEVPSENYLYQECYWGRFSRSIILPVEVNTEDVDATFRSGILTIRLPKASKQKSIVIKVKEEDE